MIGSYPNAQLFADHKHEAFLAIAQFLGQKLGMPREWEIGHLHSLFIDGRSNERVDIARFEFFYRKVKRLIGVLPTHIGRFAQGNIDVFLPTIHHIDPVGEYPLGVANLLKLKLNAHDVFVVRDDLG